jgi:hypothetical protein
MRSPSDDKQMNDPGVLTHMKKLAENSPVMKRAEETVSCMESMLEMGE